MTHRLDAAARAHWVAECQTCARATLAALRRSRQPLSSTVTRPLRRLMRGEPLGLADYGRLSAEVLRWDALDGEIAHMLRKTLWTARLAGLDGRPSDPVGGDEA